MTVLHISGLSKAYGDHVVLDALDLEVAAGEVVCLLGASGSGKSTLLRCLDLLETTDDGDVWLDDVEISDPAVDVDLVRRDIGIVFQSFNLFPHLTVLDNVALGPRRVLGAGRGDARRAAHELLARVGLDDKAAAYPDSLSGGQQQRVALVRAMAMRPRLLLLDEVTSALDPMLVGEVLDVVRDLAASGQTIVMATHEIPFARDVADRIVFLDGGRIVEQGTPDQVLGDPQDPRTRTFLARHVGG